MSPARGPSEEKLDRRSLILDAVLTLLADVDVIQNGVWLTALLGLDRPSIRRSVARTEEIALT